MEWWDTLFLNEAFATIMGSIIIPGRFVSPLSFLSLLFLFDSLSLTRPISTQTLARVERSSRFPIGLRKSYEPR